MCEEGGGVGSEERRGGAKVRGLKEVWGSGKGTKGRNGEVGRCQVKLKGEEEGQGQQRRR